MTVTLTLNEITTEQAEQILDLLRGGSATVKAESAAKTEKIIPEEFEDMPSPAPELTEETEEVTHTIEEVRSALSKLGKAKGKEAAKAILTKFGVSKVTELKAEQYGAVLKEVG